MSRSAGKPFYVSRATHCFNKQLLYYIFSKNVVLSIISQLQHMLGTRRLCIKMRLRYNIRGFMNRCLNKRDTITRLTLHHRLRLRLPIGIPPIVTAADKTSVRAMRQARIKTFFAVSAMLCCRVGGFFITRDFRGYRLKKDAQKLAKVTKDVLKDVKKQKHLVEEKARIRKKAMRGISGRVKRKRGRA